MDGSGARRDEVLSAPRDVADLEELLDSVGDQISVWDPELRLIYANRAVVAWLGRSLSDVRGTRFRDLVGVDVAQHVEPFVAAAGSSGTVDYQRVLAGPDGRQHTVAVRVSACRPGGQLAGFVMFGVDLTVRADARSAQRAETARTDLLAERDRIAADLDEGIARGLRAMLAMLRDAGTVRDSFQQPLEHILEPIIIGIGAGITELRRAIGQLTDVVPLGPEPAVPTVPRRSSAAGWNSALPSMQPAASTSSQWTLEEALAFVDELPGLTAWDVEQVNCFANRLAVRGIGKDSRTDMIGRTRAQLFGPEVAERSRPYAEAATGGTTQRYDSDFVDGAGVRRLVHFVYHPVRRAGRPIGMVAVLNDLEPADPGEAATRLAALRSDRVRIAEDLHDHVIQQLYAASLALEAATVARAPAASLEHALDCLAAAIHWLTVSIHQLHVPSGITDQLAATIRRATVALGFAPRLDTVGDLARLDRAVAADLLAVLTEALSNAARHAAANDVHITLSAAGQALWLRVTDNGRGIGVTTRSSGLANLASRARRQGGSFAYRPNHPGGTIIDWRVPL